MPTVAKSTIFQLGTAGTPGTPVDISAKVTSVKFNQVADSHDSTNFGSAGAHQFNAGFTNGTIQVEAIYDAALDTQISALLGVDNVAFVYGPMGSTVGNPKKTGNCMLAKWEPPAQVNQIEKCTFELQITGLVTAGNY